MRHSSRVFTHSLALTSLLVVGCSSKPATTVAAPEPDDDAAVADVDAVPTATPSTAPVVDEGGWTVGPSARGVPHNSRIGIVALAPSGNAAATIDVTGKVRVWPALDGSAEPVPLPVRAVSRLSLARVGDQLLVAAIDTARTLRLISVSSEAGVDPVYTGTPSAPVTDVAVLESTGVAAILRADRSIVFRSRLGVELARYDKRSFRPKAIFPAGSNTIVAMETDGSTVKLHRFVITLTPAGARVKKLGTAREIDSEGFVDAAGMMAASFDGKRFVAVRNDTKKGQWSVEIISLDSDADPVIAPLGTNPTSAPFSVGFLSNDTAAVRFAQGGATWRVDAKSGALTTVAVRHSANDVGRAIGRDRIVVAIASSLYAYTPSTGKSLYLSYRMFFPISGAASPSGKRLAYVSGRDLYVSERDKPAMRWRELGVNFNLRFVAFGNEDHLVLVSNWGELRIINWTTGKIVARQSGPGAVAQVLFDPERRLLLLMPQMGQVWLVGVGADGKSFVGPHIVADGLNRVGFLGGSTGSVLWTLDPSNVLRHYNWDEIKAGVTRVSARLRGMRVTHVHPIAVDREGRLIANINLGGRAMIGAFNGPEVAKVNAESVSDEPGPLDAKRNFRVSYQKPDAKTAITSPHAVHASPDGRQLIVAAQGLASASDAASLETKWSLAFPNSIGSVSWNKGSSVVGLTTSEGIVFVKASDGEVIHRTCGPVFVASAEPPPGLHGRGGFTQSICEAE